MSIALLLDPVVDIELVDRKRCNNNIEATLVIKASEIVSNIRTGIIPFKSMFDLVDMLRSYQDELMRENKRYNPLRIYSWSNHTSGRHNIIELQRLKEETAISQIVLRTWPAPASAAPKRGPGRPSGSGKRTEQLKVRCSTEVKNALHQLQANFFKGKSEADIIEDLILNNLAYQMMCYDTCKAYCRPGSGIGRRSFAL